MNDSIGELDICVLLDESFNLIVFLKGFDHFEASPFHLFLFLRCVQQRITGERPKLEIRGQRRSIEREFLSNDTLEFIRCHLPFNRYPTETSISLPFPL